ncbi:MAG: AAA family ATPase [Deltaproteobacteria bacterium]|nr:AAA family ATPase [Deltaproteobacteria bacterium]
MELSPSLQFVMLRAQAEVAAAKSKNMSLEFIFLGMLKLAEIAGGDIVEGSDSRAAVDADIAEVKKILKGAGLDSTRARGLLRHEVGRGVAHDERALVTRLAEASARAKKRGADEIWARDMLPGLLQNPTEAMLRVLPLKNKPGGGASGPPGEDGRSGEAGEESRVDEMSRDFLPSLTNRIRLTRATLLNDVQGQDHVVHAFVEGVFAAEVLAASDEKRVRPRAIFVFAGPPGVGKTFLAEQAAASLALPFKRFDMSSFSDHQSSTGLVGFERSYQGAKAGTLTSFVKENPHSILLFDEIEKAHINTIHLFLQVLDAGRLTDRFLDEDVAFKDTLIIFTSNAGRSLYEGDARQDSAGVPRKTLLNALETEKNAQTGQPFFPGAITSRMATGWPLLFNHLRAHNLEKISVREMSRFCALFEKQYGVRAEAEDLVGTALLFGEGGTADARTLRARTELFFKNEVFKVCRLFSEENFEARLAKLNRLVFKVETDKLPAEVRPLFFCDETPEILLYGSPLFPGQDGVGTGGYALHQTQSVNDALALAGEKDIRLALVDVAVRSAPPGPADLRETVFADSPDLLLSGAAFDFAPMAAGMFRDGNRLFNTLRQRLPDLPVYLLETDEFPIDDELLMSYVRAGARGKLVRPTGDFTVFNEQIALVCRELYSQGVAARLASERKVLYFETAPKLSEDQGEITVRLRDFSLKRATDADDAGGLLDDVEKPSIRFGDVIGAAEAKDELKFFIDYLKNPKKFTARGLKPPKGVLLYGPPGTGKTMLAKAMAGESDVAFIPAVASSFVTKYQGSGPEAVRSLFKKARRYAPAIVFIDEIDAVGRKRGESNTSHGEEMALNALLTEMDGFSVDPKRPVFVLAATNFDVEEGQGGMGVIDAALARRFDRKVLVDLPNAAERELFFRFFLAKNKTHTVSEEMIVRLASRSTGMSPANLTSVIELANRMAVKADVPLSDALLDEAYELIKHGAKKEWGYEYLERVARHESGHAFLCYLGGHTPSYLTIVARGGHGGYMEHASDESGPLSTKEELISRVRTSLGGRAAEIVYYGERDGVSTGASGDLSQATKIIRAMIASYGMDSEFGLGVMDQREAASSPELNKRVNEILAQEMRETIGLIAGNKPRIDRMVTALLERNKLSGQEMEELLKD